MKFGGGEGGQASEFHRALIQDYYDHAVSVDDVKRELESVGENESEFWSDYRDKYDPYATDDGSGGDAFLDSIGGPVEHEPGVFFDLEHGDVHRPERPEPADVPVVVPTVPPNQTPVPKPAVPGDRRGSGDRQKKPSAVVRVARSIGRFFGFGRNKK